MLTQSYWASKFKKKVTETVTQYKERITKKRLQYMCYELGIPYHEDYTVQDLQICILESLVEKYQNRDISNGVVNFLENT